MGKITKLSRRALEFDVPALDDDLGLISIKKHGAIGDGSDATQAFLEAASVLQAGQTLYVPNGTYKLTGGKVPIALDDVVIEGPGTVVTDAGFLITGNNVKIRDIHFKANSYNANVSPIAAVSDAKAISNITLDNCVFENFAYAFIAQSTSYPITGVTITKCESTAPTDKDSGHFNLINCSDVTIADNHTYGGKTNASYKISGAGGYVRLSDNYDDGASLTSVFVDNASGKVTTSGNTFKGKVWLNDSSNVVVEANTIDKHVFVSLRSFDVRNILITNNFLNAVIVDTYTSLLTTDGPPSAGLTSAGTLDATKLIRGLGIKNNKFIGGAGSAFGYAVSINGTYSETVTLTQNEYPGLDYTTGKINISRASTLKLYMFENIVNGNVSIANTGGTVYSWGNTGATYPSGKVDTTALETLFSASSGAALGADQSPWIAVVLQNGWVNDPSWNVTAQYRKDLMGVVRMTGAIKGGVGTINTVLFTLPVGCRPAKNKTVALIAANYGTIAATVRVDGAVVLSGTLSDTNTQSVYLDAISFYAEQ